MRKFSYFDAHCDTIYRCMMDSGETALCFGANSEEQQKFFADCTCLRQNNGHIDLQRTGSFSRYAQFFALFAHKKAGQSELWSTCCRLHQRYLDELAENRDRIVHCTTAADIAAAAAAGKCAALLSVEGADLLDCEASRIETVASWGVRLLNPVWNDANVLCGTNCEDTDRGLSQKGRDFIRELETNRIYTDVSHMSDAAFWDLIRIAKRPVIASHSNARALCPHGRNLTDDMFRAIRDCGGVVGINYYRPFVGDDGSMDALIAHIEHFLALDGEKTVCLGGDMDGCEELAGGMRGLQDVPKLYTELKQRGYSDALLEDIFWNNLERLL